MHDMTKSFIGVVILVALSLVALALVRSNSEEKKREDIVLVCVEYLLLCEEYAQTRADLIETRKKLQEVTEERDALREAERIRTSGDDAVFQRLKEPVVMR